MIKRKVEAKIVLQCTLYYKMELDAPANANKDELVEMASTLATTNLSVEKGIYEFANDQKNIDDEMAMWKTNVVDVEDVT